MTIAPSEQPLLIPGTESRVDFLWSEWQQLSEANRLEFLSRIHRQWVTAAHAKKAELQSRKKTKPTRKQYTQLANAAKQKRMEANPQ